MHIFGFTAEQRIQYIFNTLNKYDDSYVSSIVDLLESDPSPIVRHEAAYILGEINSEQSVNALINAINNDRNRFVIHESLLALANLESNSSEDIIRKQLSHVDLDVSTTAIIAIQRLDMKIKKERLTFDDAKTLILNNETLEEKRIQSAFILLEEGSDFSIELLIKALYKESNPIVKHEIVFCLGEVASKIAFDALINILDQGENDFVIHETLLALSTLGYIEAKSYIDTYLTNEISEIAESAEIALERLLTV